MLPETSASIFKQSYCVIVELKPSYDFSNEPVWIDKSTLLTVKIPYCLVIAKLDVNSTLFPSSSNTNSPDSLILNI